MTWKQIADDNLVAAKLLQSDGRWRSSVSRSYYAAYAEVTSKLVGRAMFPDDREGPSHDALPKLVMTYLTMVGFRERKKVAATAHRLYMARIDADYIVRAEVEQTAARSAVQDASSILRTVRNANR